MGHNVRTFVGAKPYVARAVSVLPTAIEAPLAAGFAAIPLTDELFDAIQLPSPTATINGTVFLTESILSAVSSVFGTHPFCYLETGYTGGVGTQCSGAWAGDEVLFQPSSVPDAINLALRAIGCPRFPDKEDEFDTVGLRAYRSMDDF